MSFNNGSPSSNSGKLTAYRGHVVSPIDRATYKDIPEGVIVVDENGLINAVGKWSDFQRQQFSHVVNYGKQLIMPGFIDLHIHLAQIAQAGRSGDTLLGWLTKYIFPEEAKFASVDHAQHRANWFFRELAANGTTLASVFTSVHGKATDIAFKAADAFGSRVIMGRVFMDTNSPESLTDDPQKALAESDDLCSRWHGKDNDRLMYAFTPRFAPTSTSASMKAIGELWARHPGSYMQTHLSENIDEIKWVAQLFPSCKNYLDVYHTHGLTGKNSLFAHSIHLSDDEKALLVKTSSSVAHCPSSNFFLKSGAFPIREMERAGVKFGLGSDVAAGPEMSMFKVMRDAAFMQSVDWLSPAELLYLATLAGAVAVNKQDRLGSLDAGKEADFIIVDPTRKSSVDPELLEHPAEDILSNLVYVGDDRMIVSTYVRGKAIYEAKQAETPGALNYGSRVS
jgi:guanine deaminase